MTGDHKKAFEIRAKVWYNRSITHAVGRPREDVKEGGSALKEIIEGAVLTGERALYQKKDAILRDTVFEDGESPLKHSAHITMEGGAFRWKYPLWYSEDIAVTGTTFEEMARAGIWYTKGIAVRGCRYIAPKGFRRCDGVTIEDTVFPNAAETLWECRNVTMRGVTAKGDYLGMGCVGMEIDGLDLDGNYCFDGARDVHIRDSRLMSKDAFWNSDRITAERCEIRGEYLGWNSKHLTLIDCTIESLQGLCYCEDLTLVRCRLAGTTLAFEFSTVDADIVGTVDSVKDPLGGIIRADGIGTLILEPDVVDITRTRIILGEERTD
ncbi:MAG: DUF3737 family protein [Oscillospiraceae bacterium]|nr:DUF3737 family protein [Oscillospiraceae bacterium]